MPKKLKEIVSIFLGALLLVSCYEPTDGCLDIIAANYDVSAFNACDDCCTYPNFSLQINHRLRDDKLTFGDTIELKGGQKVILLDQKLQLSNIQPFFDSNTFFRNLDSIALEKNGVTSTFTKDDVYCRTSQESLTISTYKGDGQISGYTFQFGVEDAFDDISETEAATYGPIAYKNGMRTNDAYASYWVKFAANPIFKDTFEIFIVDDIQFTIDTLLTIPRGGTLRLPLTIEYDKWYENIDFANPDVVEITEKLRANTTNAFK